MEALLAYLDPISGQFQTFYKINEWSLLSLYSRFLILNSLQVEMGWLVQKEELTGGTIFPPVQNNFWTIQGLAVFDDFYKSFTLLYIL